MTAAVQNTLTTNTFDFWRSRTNELAYAMTNLAVTVNSNTAVGNAAITGKFTANSLSVSNGTTSVAIPAPSSAAINNNNYYLNANGTWSYIPTNNGAATIVSAGPYIVDSFPMSSWNSAEYLLSVRDNGANSLVTTKILITHDTSTAYTSEYGTITTNSSIGVFSANSNTSHVILNFVPSVSSANVKFARTLV